MTTPDTRRSAARNPRAPTRWIILLAVFAALVAAALVFKRSAQLVKVVDQAMEPTLHRGDIVVVARAHQVPAPPARGDLVLVRSRQEETLWFRRVVGLPGETIEIKDNALLVDGREVAEPHVAQGEPFVTGATPVGPGQVLLLPDNRREEMDISRLALELTPVAMERLQGRATRIVWPLPRWHRLR